MKSQLDRIRFLLGTVLPLLLRTRRRPVLFVRSGAMGDIICTFPAVLELKKRHPHAAFIYSCLPDFACLPRLASVTPHVTPTYIAPESRWKFLFSAVYHFQYADERADTASTQTIIAEFCRQHGVPVTDEHPALHNEPRAIDRVKKILAEQETIASPLILLHLGPSWPVREWPRDSWVALIHELKKHGLTNLIQIGNGRHVQMGAVQDTATLGVFDLVNQLTLEESIALISLAGMLIGIDSGLLHIAAVLRIPAVGVFGPTSPQFRFSKSSCGSFVVSRVECQGCHHRVPRLHWMTGCPHDVKCMKTIPVDEVLQAVLQRLSATPSPVPEK